MIDNAFASLVPEHIRTMPRYVPGKPVEEAAREGGLDPASIVKLASNENPLGLSETVKAAVVVALDGAERYPDAHGHDLRQAITRKLGVAPGQIVLGNGSADLIAMTAQTFLRTETSVVISQYAFAAYLTSARVQGAEIVRVPAVDFGHNIAGMTAAIRPDTRLVYIDNPNNPTGTHLPPAMLKKFVAAIPRDVIVVVDEAYREYQPREDVPDTIAWIAEYPNLLILRTLSKAYALGGLRLGFGVGSTDVIDLINCVRQTFNVNLLAQVAGVAALDDEDHLARTFAMNRAGMAQLGAGLTALGIPWTPSAANFVMVEVEDGPAVYRALLAKGVIVRSLRPNYDLVNHLRISIGTEAENARLLEALAAVLAERREPATA
ncbi:MAG: histidinol-phosphate transaminase [Pseudomonadota bacterium]